MQQYSTITLAEVYRVIGYYLSHRDEIKAYLVTREQEAQNIRARIESQQKDLTDLRHRLLARKNTL